MRRRTRGARLGAAVTRSRADSNIRIRKDSVMKRTTRTIAALAVLIVAATPGIALADPDTCIVKPGHVAGR